MLKSYFAFFFCHFPFLFIYFWLGFINGTRGFNVKIPYMHTVYFEQAYPLYYIPLILTWKKKVKFKLPDC
jgi:hypothetical protein